MVSEPPYTRPGSLSRKSGYGGVRGSLALVNPESAAYSTGIRIFFYSFKMILNNLIINTLLILYTQIPLLLEVLKTMVNRHLIKLESE